MGQFFTTIYCLFDDLFGLELASYLAGEATERQQSNMFMSIGLAMIGISLLVAVIFYYVVNELSSTVSRFLWEESGTRCMFICAEGLFPRCPVRSAEVSS